MTTYPLQINILGPNNETFRRNVDPIPYVGNVTDDCSATLGTGVVNSSITFFALTDGWSGWSLCSGVGVEDNNNGTYNCTKNSPVTAYFRRYNLTMNATKQYYNNSQTPHTHPYAGQFTFRLSGEMEFPDGTKLTFSEGNYGFGYTPKNEEHAGAPSGIKVNEDFVYLHYWDGPDEWGET